MSRLASRGNRLSVPHFPGASSRFQDEAAERAFLFVRDLPLGILPFKVDNGGFRASLRSGSEERTTRLVEVLAGERYPQGNLTDVLAAFMSDLTQTLAYRGIVHFEVVPLRPGECGRRRFAIERLPVGRVINLGSHYVQVVPKDARNEVGKRAVWLPETRLWIARLPRSLGSPRKHRRLLRSLARVSAMPPSFARSSPFGSDVPGFDFGTFRLACDAQVEYLTREWGGIPSLHQIEGTSEFYLFARSLQFRGSQALIREQLVSDLNTLLPKLGLDDQLVVSGLPSSGEIAELARLLQAGEIDFAAAMARSRV